MVRHTSSGSIFCKIFKVYLTILGHYALKGRIIFIILYMLLTVNILRLTIRNIFISFPRPSKRKKHPEMSRTCGYKWKRVRGITKEQYKNMFIKLKGRAPKFHKSIITFWAKANLKPEKKQKSAAVRFNVHNWFKDYLSITLFKSFLLSRKFEINSLKFAEHVYCQRVFRNKPCYAFK